MPGIPDCRQILGNVVGFVGEARACQWSAGRCASPAAPQSESTNGRSPSRSASPFRRQIAGYPTQSPLEAAQESRQAAGKSRPIRLANITTQARFAAP